MMKPFLSIIGVSALSTLGIAFACSSDGGQLGPGDTGASGTTNGTGTSSGGGSGTGVSAGSSSGVGGGSGIAIGEGGNAPFDGCEAIAENAQLTPINMVIMFDKSGSMGDQTGGEQNYQSRWVPVRQGMINFFSTAGSTTTGIMASLSYFPAPGDLPTTCSNNYTTPNVSLTDLTTPDRLINSLNGTEPGGGTPTLSAVYGATTYAKKLMNDNPGSKSVVILVTDGAPAMYVTENETTGDLNGDGEVRSYVEENCVPSALRDSTLLNTIPDIATVVNGAAQNDPQVPTYVVGIGTNLGNLDEIANAGGTTLILIDPTDPPEQTTNTITSTLQSIRVSQFSCEMTIPMPPEGQTFDKDMVNVNFVHSNLSVEQLVRSDSCAISGWHYDNPDNPTLIQLCPQTCNAVQNDTGGQIQVAFGCETIYIPPK